MVFNIFMVNAQEKRYVARTHPEFGPYTYFKTHIPTVVQIIVNLDTKRMEKWSRKKRIRKLLSFQFICIMYMFIRRAFHADFFLVRSFPLNCYQKHSKCEFFLVGGRKFNLTTNNTAHEKSSAHQFIDKCQYWR